MDFYNYSFTVHFPDLKNEGFKITSPKNPGYNCIAWAASNDEQWWEPDPLGTYYWPNDLKREYSLDVYVKLYEKFGYTICKSSRVEKLFEKVAIYVSEDNVPLHAARQLKNGKWTSKLGKHHDIEHTLKGLQGKVYGSVAVILKRALKSRV
jgi:hypothetical protein